MAFGKKLSLPAMAAIKIPAPPTAGGGGALDEHGFSPGHHAGAGGREPDAAGALNLARVGRFGFGGAKKGGLKPPAGC